jgi:DNA-binding beta-propeller fold protein YncE
MKGALISILILAIPVIFDDGCGRKYPIPPESHLGMPPESSYVKVSGWPEGELEVSNPREIYLGRDGYLYLIDDHGVRRLYTNGQMVPDFSLEGIEGPVAITQAKDFTIIVADSAQGKVAFYTLSGEFKGEFFDTTLRTIGGLTVDDEFRIYISDYERDLVLVYDTLGNIIDTLSSYGSGILNVEYPMGLFYFEGAVYIASTGHNWVEALTVDTPRYNVLHLGGNTPEGGSDDTLFLYPVDVSVDTSGAVYVADYGNGRVQKFTHGGEFVVSVFAPEWETDSLRPVSCAVKSDGMSLFVAFKGKTRDVIEKFIRPVRPEQGGVP